MVHHLNGSIVTTFEFLAVNYYWNLVFPAFVSNFRCVAAEEIYCRIKQSNVWLQQQVRVPKVSL